MASFSVISSPLLGSLSVLLFILAAAVASYWVIPVSQQGVTGEVDFGLFRYCATATYQGFSDSECGAQSADCSDSSDSGAISSCVKFNAIRAFVVISILLSAISTAFQFLFVSKDMGVLTHRVVVGLCSSAAITAGISLSLVFNFIAFDSSWHFGFAFFAHVFGFLIILINTLVFFKYGRRRYMQDAGGVYPSTSTTSSASYQSMH